MTVTPPRTEGQSVAPDVLEVPDTAETLQAAGLELIEWIKGEQARLEADMLARVAAIAERFQRSPVPKSLTDAIMADLGKRLDALG